MAATHRVGAVRILLQFMRAQESGDPYAFRFSPQEYIVPTMGGSSPSACFPWTEEMLADLLSLRLPDRDPNVVQRIGERLRRFAESIGWDEHERELSQALLEQRPVVLTIRSSAAEIYSLPWELLTLRSGQFLGELDGILLRFEWPETHTVAEEPSPRPAGGRILVAWSAAGGAVPAAEHIQAIASAAAGGFHAFSAERDVLAHASLARISNVLVAAQKTCSPIAVLHILCHGGRLGSTFGLTLDGEDGVAVVDGTQLRQHLAPFAKMVRLIVLSACDSGNSGTLNNYLGSVAQSLHRCGFEAVLASRLPLSVAGSIQLSESLYGELLTRPASLESALLATRKRLLMKDSNTSADKRSFDWASVQLYARHDDGDDTRPIVFRPFRGLLAFQPEHRRFFFGRDPEVETVCSRLQALIAQKKKHFLIVTGASGTGKSSLVLAGTVPKIVEEHPQLTILQMRPGSDPEQTLDRTLTALSPSAPALLIVDQFEEIFTQTADPMAREAFVRRLWSFASASGAERIVIITLRVDFVGRCGELVLNDAGLRLDRIAYDETHRVFVAQLSPEQLRRAIEAPVHVVGLDLQAGLTNRLLVEVGREPGALPILEDALDVLWQRREGRMLTQDAYHDMGGVVGALRKRADAILDKLSTNELALSQRLLMSLVAVSDETALDTRRRVPLSELQRSCLPNEILTLARVLKLLLEARLLVQDGDGKVSHVEVAHETLIRNWPRLRTWLDENRTALILQRQLQQATQQWESKDRDESLLYRGTQLAQMLESSRNWGALLGDLERKFLHASEAQRLRLAGQRFILLTMAVILAIVTVAGGPWAYSVFRKQQLIAREAARTDISGEIIASGAGAGGWARETKGGGLYTNAILNKLQQQDKSVLEALQDAHEDVRTLSQTAQRPLLSTTMNGQLYLWRQPENRQKYAIVISISDIGLSSIATIPAPQRDADGMQRLLLAAGFHERDIVRLHNATATVIWNAVAQSCQEINANQQHSSILGTPHWLALFYQSFSLIPISHARAQLSANSDLLGRKPGPKNTLIIFYYAGHGLRHYGSNYLTFSIDKPANYKQTNDDDDNDNDDDKLVSLIGIDFEEIRTFLSHCAASVVFILDTSFQRVVDINRRRKP